MSSHKPFLYSVISMFMPIVDNQPVVWRLIEPTALDQSVDQFVGVSLVIQPQGDVLV